jgi:sporulation protein YlmC with PRC-barrel domain
MQTIWMAVLVMSLTLGPLGAAVLAQQPAGQPATQTQPPAASSGVPSMDSSSPAASPSTSSDQSSSAATQSAQATPSTQAPADQNRFMLDASAVIGSTVRSNDGKDIGKVSRLMIDPREGRVNTVVIGIGGTMGVGEKLVSVPWNSVRIGQDNGKMIVTVEQGLLEQVPKAEKSADKNGKKNDKSEGAASPSTQGQKQ